MGEDCCSIQLIDGDGVFNVSGIEKFMKMVNLAECGLSYAVVSIMGPQSSGVFASLANAFFPKKKNLFEYNYLNFEQHVLFDFLMFLFPFLHF